MKEILKVLKRWRDLPIHHPQGECEACDEIRATLLGVLWDEPTLQSLIKAIEEYLAKLE